MISSLLRKKNLSLSNIFSVGGMINEYKASIKLSVDERNLECGF